MDLPAKLGDKNNTAKEIQSLLNLLGYNLLEDGHFGENTENAVKYFQKQNSLLADGVVGKNTYGKLLEKTKDKTTGLKRKIPFCLPDPNDISSIPSPKLTFSKQKPNSSFPTGGLFSSGNIKFNLNNKNFVELAKESFLKNSIHHADINALPIFLLSLSITSKFEAGFDGVNTYDRAGISLGFIQFARPEGGVGKLLDMIGRNDLSKKVMEAFGTKDPHNTSSAIKARFDMDLLKELVQVVSTDDGIEAQLAMTINKNVDNQLYFDKSYSRFLQLGLKDPMTCAFLFDASVNMGVGSLRRFNSIKHGQTDGDWIVESINLLKRPERREGWDKIIKENFIIGSDETNESIRKDSLRVDGSSNNVF